MTRRDLERLPLRALHPARNWSKADVLLAEWPPDSGRRVVVKDLKKRALWFRVLAGRYMLRREWRALRVLQGLAGVPRVVARPDADSLVIEYVEGTPLSDIARRRLPEGALERIESQLSALHARGVTHADLHRENILIGENGAVWFLDWATASVFPARRNAFKEWSFAEWRALDLRAIAKLKIFNARDALTEHDYALLEGGASPFYRAVKAVRRASDKLRGKEELPDKIEIALRELRGQRETGESESQS